MNQRQTFPVEQVLGAEQRDAEVDPDHVRYRTTSREDCKNPRSRNGGRRGRHTRFRISRRAGMEISGVNIKDPAAAAGATVPSTGSKALISP